MAKDQETHTQEEALGEALKRLHEIQSREEEEAVWVQEHVARIEQALLESATEWLRLKWGDPPICPYCNHDQWELGTPLSMLLASGEVLSPHFPIMCSNCGQTVFINAVRAGLVPEEEP